MTRRRRERRDADEDEAVVGCLDVLRGASALVAQHKAGLARLLPRRDERERGALERLVSDLTEVLSTASTSSGGGSSRPQAVERERGEEQEEGAVSDLEGVARRGGGGGRAMAGGGAKRAKAQQAAQTDTGQQQELASSSAAVVACEGRDALAIPEVLEHVMSFAEDTELLGRLSRVCRLWRRVSEGEGLSLRVVERRMPSAVVGGQESLHARLGGSARRCLLAHNASMTAGRLIRSGGWIQLVEGLALLVEVIYGDTVLCAASGKLRLLPLEEGLSVDIQHSVRDMEHGVHTLDVQPFSAASLGLASVHDMFTEGDLWVRFCAMDVATGVTASLFQGWFYHQGELPEPMQFSKMMGYSNAPAPVTSVTYAGPPLQAQVSPVIVPCQTPDEGEADVLTQTERQWRFCLSPSMEFRGQPSIYGEQLIRTRLAEEAMAAKKQHGSR